MPPWLPDPGYVHFAGERWLSEEDIETIEYWVLLGAKEGDPAKRPAPPEFSGDWQLGEPDLVIQMPQAYRLEAGGTDVFRNFVVPVPVTETRYARGLEFRPGNVNVVHHAGVQLDATNSSQPADDRDEQPGFDGMQRTNMRMPDGHMLGWIFGPFGPFGPFRPRSLAKFTTSSAANTHLSKDRIFFGKVIRVRDSPQQHV